MFTICSSAFLHKSGSKQMEVNLHKLYIKKGDYILDAQGEKMSENHILNYLIIKNHQVSFLKRVIKNETRNECIKQ